MKKPRFTNKISAKARGVGGAPERPSTTKMPHGAGGFPAWGIPPNGSLKFELEVLSIQGKNGGTSHDEES